MEQKKSNRLHSLDALRGFDMFFIMGGAGLLGSLSQIWSNPVTDWIAIQMQHAEWDGFQHHDIIFPLFLFIAGISFPFSLANKLAKNETKFQIQKDIFRRGIILFLLGILYNNGLNFDFPHMRYMSVLGRIGLAWMFGALIYTNFKQRAHLIWIATILVGYYLLLAFVPAPDAPAGASNFSPQGNFAGWIDRILLFGTWAGKYQDPEGILSTIPAIATALLGMQAGRFIKWETDKVTPAKKALYLLLIGIALVIVGQLWGELMPINKKLWSSSFVCFVGGLGFIHIALFYYVIDVLNFKKWSSFFTVIGMNSITIYLAQRIIGFTKASEFFSKGFIAIVPDYLTGFVSSIFYIGVCWYFLYFLYKHKIFLKV